MGAQGRNAEARNNLKTKTRMHAEQRQTGNNAVNIRVSYEIWKSASFHAWSTDEFTYLRERIYHKKPPSLWHLTFQQLLVLSCYLILFSVEDVCALLLLSEG
jgi:hypothetical protein